MTEQEIFLIFKRLGGIITGSHIIYTTGKHGDSYINKDAIYPHTGIISLFCQEIAQQFTDCNIEVVAAPATGGIVLTQWTAHHLSQILRREVLAVYADKTPEGKFIIKRGYDKLIQNKNVLLLEDVVNTGHSVQKTIDAILKNQAKIVGLSALAERGIITTEELTQKIPNLVKTFFLLKLKFQIWDKENCPLCRKKIPINTDIGKGKK